MSRSQDKTESLTLLAGGHLPSPKDGPSVQLLQVFPNVYPHRPYVIQIGFPEFTSLCPVTGQPDFANIVIEYIPDMYCVESKSLKLYMFAFRQHQSFMETISNTILEDLVTVLDPCWIHVTGLFVPRGGTSIHVYADHWKTLPPEKSREIRHRVHNYYLEKNRN